MANSDRDTTAFTPIFDFYRSVSSSDDSLAGPESGPAVLRSSFHEKLKVALMQASLDALQSAATQTHPDYSYRSRSHLWAMVMMKGIESFVKDDNHYAGAVVERRPDQKHQDSLFLLQGSRVARVAILKKKDAVGISLEQEGVKIKFYPAPYLDGGLIAAYVAAEELRIISRLATGIQRVLWVKRAAHTVDSGQGRLSREFIAIVKQCLQDISPALDGTPVVVPYMDKVIIERELVRTLDALVSDQDRFPGVIAMQSLSERMNFLAQNLPPEEGVQKKDPLVQFVALGLLAADAAGRKPEDVMKAAQELYMALRSSSSVQGAVQEKTGFSSHPKPD